jgi:hypothetical protein
MRRRPDLIVPIHDRRKRRRFLTLRNFRNVAIAALIVFVALTVYSDWRGSRSGDYGRLLSSQLPSRVESRPIEVVQEAGSPPVDQTHADPMLVQPLAREQWLQDDEPKTATIATTTATIAPTTTIAPVPVEASATAGKDVTIVGGQDGVSIVRAPRRRAVLSGGFGRSDSN